MTEKDKEDFNDRTFVIGEKVTTVGEIRFGIQVLTSMTEPQWQELLDEEPMKAVHVVRGTASIIKGLLDILELQKYEGELNVNDDN